MKADIQESQDYETTSQDEPVVVGKKLKEQELKQFIDEEITDRKLPSDIYIENSESISSSYSSEISDAGFLYKRLKV